MKSTTFDTIVSQLPQHVRELYPNFVEFLESYYAWLNMEGNPYERIKHHMDYVSFEKSLDDYTNAMFNEYLSDIPSDVRADKEKLIEWSKKLNLSRGSHDSFKFLFRVLFNEQDTEIYLPKDNILRGSDGVWVANQSVMIVTNPGNPDDLLYRRIYQSRETFPGIFEHAEATVEAVQVSYAGRFNTVYLTIVDIVGEFKEDHPVKVRGVDDLQVWPVKTIVDFDITEGGTNYFTNEMIVFEVFDQRYVRESLVVSQGVVDTRITTLLSKGEITVSLDDEPFTDFEYDGQFLYSDSFTLGRKVTFVIDQVYVGTMKIGEVGRDGRVQRIFVEAPPIAVMPDRIPVSYDLADEGTSGWPFPGVDLSKTTSVGLGSGLEAYAIGGVVRKIPGYYANSRGWLSSNMYLQDNYYYQEYSYEIKTVQEFSRYADIVKKVLHPSGFKMFGHVRIYSLIEALIGVTQDSGARVQSIVAYHLSRYSAGSNLLWVAKNGNVLSKRVYKDGFFPQDYIDGDEGYDLEDKGLERTLDLSGNPLIVDKVGWMSKHPYSDADVRQPQDYILEDPYRDLYFESSYVAGTFDETEFINKYIDIYAAFDYTDEEYAE